MAILAVGDTRALYVEAPPGGTAVMVAKCPVPLSNIRVSGSGSPRLAKFRVYYSDNDAAGTVSRVLVSSGRNVYFSHQAKTATITSGGVVACSMNSNTTGNTRNAATTYTAICSVPYTFKAKVFYDIGVILLANSGGNAQFFWNRLSVTLRGTGHHFRRRCALSHRSSASRTTSPRPRSPRAASSCASSDRGARTVSASIGSSDGGQPRAPMALVDRL